MLQALEKSDEMSNQNTTSYKINNITYLFQSILKLKFHAEKKK